MDVYVEPVNTRYTANSIGAYLLVLFSYIAVIVAPLAIGFGMGQFWITSNVLVGRPDITYTNRLIVRVETAEGNAMVYVSSPTAMEELENAIIAGENEGAANVLFNFKNPLDPASSELAPLSTMYPAVNVFEDDHDSNGIVDGFHFQIAIPMNYSAPQTVGRICILPEFNYVFDYPVPSLDIRMTAAPLICLSSPNPTTAFEGARLQGDLVFKASTLPESSDYVRYDRIYAGSLFNEFTARELAAVSPIANAYALRNFTLGVEEKSNTFGAYDTLAMASTNIDPTNTFHQFNLEVSLKVHDSVIRYIPPWYENLKFGWVQYFCIAFIVYYFLDFIKSILVKQAIINTIAIWEGRQRVIN